MKAPRSELIPPAFTKETPECQRT